MLQCGLISAAGASHLTTVEFRPTLTQVPNHSMVTPIEWAREMLNGSTANVDFAFSFSSWEHDGLGRYGDPIDAWGDVKAVQKASCYVKPGEAHSLSVTHSHSNACPSRAKLLANIALRRMHNSQSENF